MPGDLHTHTTFSDGSTPADKLPFLAACAGMTHLAISDHDSIESVRYAHDHPLQNGVHLIPATELTAYDYERAHRVHLLCYWPDDCAALADFSHSPADQAATISSGSFRTDGMIVIPCSMKTLAGIRAGYAEGLVGRAADVVLKEGRKLVLVPREMPLSTIHLENMLALSRMGVAMVPPMPAYYNHPETVDDITNHIVTRVLDQFGLDYHKARRWNGLRTAEQFAQEIE